MIAFVEMTVTFAALTALCLFLNTKTRLAAGLTPLFVLCGTMVWYSTLGSVHMLVPAGIVWFGAAAAACVWLWRKHKDIRWREFFSPAMVYFLLASLAVIVLFAVRRPIFNEWDEFSFWGIAPKVVKTENQLYTYNPGEMRVSTFVPGIIMLDYAFQFLGSVFVPWKVYAAYDILFFAVFAAAISMLGRRHWHIAVPAAAVLTLVPYMVSVYQRGIYVQTTYMNAYSDIPMGLLFGAGLVLYFAPRKKTPILMTGAVLAVTASCLSKDMGFALCLIAAAIICFDLLFVQKEDVPFFRLKGLGGKLCWCASLVGAPLAAFFGWAAHMSVVLGSNRFDIGGSADMGMVQMVTTGIAELLGIGRTQKFTDIMELMKSAFFNTRLTMFSVGAPDAGAYFQRLGLHHRAADFEHSAGGIPAGRQAHARAHGLDGAVEHAGLCGVLYLHGFHLCVCVQGRAGLWAGRLQPLYLSLLCGLAGVCRNDAVRFAEKCKAR